MFFGKEGEPPPRQSNKLFELRPIARDVTNMTVYHEASNLRFNIRRYGQKEGGIYYVIFEVYVPDMYPFYHTDVPGYNPVKEGSFKNLFIIDVHVDDIYQIPREMAKIDLSQAIDYYF